MRLLVLLVALGQAPVGSPQTFAWARERGQEGMFFEVETETAGMVPCDRVRVTETEMSCTAVFPKTRAQQVRVRAALLPHCSTATGLCCDQSEVNCQSAWSEPVTVAAGDVPGHTIIRGLR